MSSKPEFRIVTYNSEEYRQLVALREKILRAPHGLTFSEEDIASEKPHVHIAGYVDGKLVASTMLNRHDGLCKVQRVAVDSSCQSSGIGTALMRFCEEFAKGEGFTSIYCHARQTAIPFYQKNGWVGEGELFDEVGIPHWKMVKGIN